MPEESYGPSVIFDHKQDKLCTDCNCNWESRSDAAACLPGTVETRCDKWKELKVENAAIKGRDKRLEERKERERKELQRAIRERMLPHWNSGQTEHIRGRKSRTMSRCILLLEPRMSRNLRPPYF